MSLRSYTITQGRDRAPARSMLKAIGFTDEDLRKPIIGIANTWIETMPCNYNLRALAEKVKEGVRAAGGAPLNEDFARQIGADAYCRDAAVAVQTAKDLIARRHNRQAAG